jgi:HK97 family phage major capsid protein
MNVNELIERRKQAHAFAVAQLHIKDNQGNMKREAMERFNKAIAEVDQLGEDIQRYQRSGLHGELGGYSTIRERKNPWTNEVEIRAALAFGKYLRQGPNALDEQESILLRTSPEKRAEAEGNLIDQIGTYSGLGYFVPAGFVYDVMNAVKWYAPIMDGKIFSVLETASGQPLPYPTSDDTAQSAYIVGESVDATSGSTDLSANHVSFGAWKYATGVILCSLELIQDSAFDLESWIAERMGIRLGRRWEIDFTNGDGSSKPIGVLPAVVAAGAVPVVANGSAETSGGSETGANSVGYTDLVRLEHSVDPAYRRGAKFLFHDTTLAYLKRILDKFGRPLWTPGMKDGAPDTVLGYSYVIDQQMPQIAASAQTVLFGDLSKYVVRSVKGLMVQRLTERYAEKGQVGFVGFARADGNFVYAGGPLPINILQQHS